MKKLLFIFIVIYRCTAMAQLTNVDYVIDGASMVVYSSIDLDQFAGSNNIVLSKVASNRYESNVFNCNKVKHKLIVKTFKKYSTVELAYMNNSNYAINGDINSTSNWDIAVNGISTKQFQLLLNYCAKYSKEYEIR